MKPNMHTPKKLQDKQKYKLMASKPKGRKKNTLNKFQDEINSQNREADNNHKKHHSHSTNLKSIGSEQFSKSNIIYMFGSRKEF